MSKILKLTLSEWLFLLEGILLQVVTFAITGGGILSFVSGLAGACSVVLCSQRKVIFYFFGFAQVITYSILVLQQQLFAQFLVQLFYLITMIVGVIVWLSNYNSDEDKVETRQLSPMGWAITAVAFVLGTAGGYLILRNTSDTQPFMDALSTVPAFIAQILMITRFKEQWIYWLIVDAITLVVWLNAQDWCMVALYAFWIVTCFYGFIKWSK